MDKSSTNISRRAVALGAPSAIALGSLGPVGTLGAVGALSGLPTAASAATSEIDEKNFIESFLPAFLKHSKAVYLHSVASVYFTNMSKKGWQIIGFQTLYTNLLWNNYAYGVLKDNGYLDKVDYKVIETMTATVSTTQIPFRPFGTEALKLYSQMILNFDDATIYQFAFNRPRLWTKMQGFLRTVIEKVDFENFLQKVDKAKSNMLAIHGRRLKDDADEMQQQLSFIGQKPTGEFKMHWGKNKQTSKRGELVRVGDWRALHLEPENDSLYTHDSIVKHGARALQQEKPVDKLNPQNNTASYHFDITGLANESLTYFINQEISVNGNVCLDRNETSDLFISTVKKHFPQNVSNTLVTNYITYLANATGFTEESAVAGGILSRLLGTWYINAARWDLVTGRIDMKLLQSNFITELANDPSLQIMKRVHQASVYKLFTDQANLIFGWAVGNWAFSIVAFEAAKQTYAENPNKSQADQQKLTVAKLRSVFAQSGLVITTAALTSWKFAAVQDFPSAALVGKYVVPNAFALGDLNSAIGDIISVVNEPGSNGGKNLSITNTLKLSGASFRGFGAGGAQILTAARQMFGWIRYDSQGHALLPIKGYDVRTKDVVAWSTTASLACYIMAIVL